MKPAQSRGNGKRRVIKSQKRTDRYHSLRPDRKIFVAAQLRAAVRFIDRVAP
jgi:hypothetical protein